MKVDHASIKKHINSRHRMAEGIDGKLVLASYGENPATGEAITPKVVQFEIGDVDNMTQLAIQWAQEDHRNVYMPLAAVKHGTSGRGKLDDCGAVFGLCVDFDDADAANYVARLPLPPTSILESSNGRYQASYLFNKVLSTDDAKCIAKALVAYSDCDGCSADVIHVWRILGTLNWPNKKKVTEGRSSKPQLVVSAPGGSGNMIDPDKLLASMPDAIDKCENTSVTLVDHGFDQPPADIEDVRAALDVLPADLPYHNWIRVLAALHSENLLELAREWSMQDGRFNEREFDSKWRSFDENKQGGVTIATVFKMSQDYHLLKVKSVMDDVIQKLKSDKECAAHFEDSAIEAAAWFFEHDIQLCRRYRREIKAAAKSMADIRNWDETLKEHIHGNDDQDSCPQGASHHVIATDHVDRLESQTGAEVAAVAGVFHIYQKDTGTYRSSPDGERIVAIAERYDGFKNCIRNSDYKAIDECIMRLRDRPDFFEHAPVGVATMGQFHRMNKDGTIATEPLSHEHRCRFAYSFEPSHKKASLWLKHLHRCFKGNDEENQVLLLQEIVGAVLFRLSSSMQQAYLFLGPSATGKSTTLTVIELLIPSSLRCASSPFSWDKEYNIATLAGKALNCVGELPDDKCIPAADFKRVIGGDTLEGRHPTHRPFHFRNSATHIFNSNHLINTRDRSAAFWRRWRIVEFSNVIEGQRDPNYGGRLEAELPQILGWAFEGAQRLVSNKYQFTRTKAHDRKMSEWMVAQNSVAEFLDDEDAVTMGETLKESGYKAYRAYQEWCRDVGRQPLGRSKFYEELEGDAGQLRKITKLPSRRDGSVFVGFTIGAGIEDFDLV